jgi:hypothetical protein
MATHARIRIFAASQTHSVPHALLSPRRSLESRLVSTGITTGIAAAILCGAFILVSGCGDDPTASEGDVTAARPVVEADEGYRVVLRGQVADTLTGRAQFGHVLDQRTGQLNWIIELITADDFAGGMFIAAPFEAMPQAQRYAISAEALSDPANSDFAVIYRHGLFRVFRARAGSLTFNHVSDTLVSGTFDVTLVGEVADRGREAVRGEAEASGSFSARRGQPGYVIGL